VKGFTDELMHLFDNVLNVRIRMPITSCNSGRNLITKLISYEYICSIPNSMTVLPELLPIMIDMAKNKDVGTINLVNPGMISHNEILKMYQKIVDKDFEWKNFSEKGSEFLVAKRSNNFLDTAKLESKYKVNRIEKAIELIMKEIAKHHNQ
jgi:3,5-epimerase/4-reductase